MSQTSIRPREAARNRLEIAVGLAVIAALVAVLVTAFSGGGVRGTILRASFSHIDGLAVGSDVRIAGVTVGHVVSETVDPRTFLATVRFSIRPDIKLTDDSSAAILSEGLLGGKYLSLTPGGDDRILGPEGVIAATQGSISLETLLGQFIGSVEGLMAAVKTQNARLGGNPPPAAKSDGLGP
jgi:phospholipid/cholesterol/gamma-HCH transport system substrate-binding protein